MSDQAKIKDTIRALLNLARNDAAADGEIHNAMAFASKLMNQHNLSEEDLDQADEKLLDLEQAERGTAESYTEGARKNWWEIHLGQFVCEFIGGVKFYSNSGMPRKTENGFVSISRDGRTQKATRLTFYGLHEDVLLAKGLYDEMVVTVAAMGRLKHGGAFRGAGRNYCEGFIDGLFEQLEDARNEERRIAESQKRLDINRNALVVIDKRQNLVEAKSDIADKYLKDRGIKLRYRASSFGGRFDRGARLDGQADGRKAKVSATRTRRIG